MKLIQTCTAFAIAAAFLGGSPAAIAQQSQPPAGNARAKAPDWSRLPSWIDGSRLPV